MLWSARVSENDLPIKFEDALQVFLITEDDQELSLAVVRKPWYFQI